MVIRASEEKRALLKSLDVSASIQVMAVAIKHSRELSVQVLRSAAFAAPPIDGMAKDAASIRTPVNAVSEVVLMIDSLVIVRTVNDHACHTMTVTRNARKLKHELSEPVESASILGQAMAERLKPRNLFSQRLLNMAHQITR